MKVIFSDRIKETGKGIEFLRPATDFLEKAITPSSAPKVTVEWDLTKDNGHTLYTLRISDWAASAEAAFTPEELSTLNPDLRFSLRRLWGDVLKKRSHIQLEELMRADGPES